MKSRNRFLAVAKGALLSGGFALGTSTFVACAPEEEVSAGESALTLSDGAKFVVSARPDRVVLATSTGDCSGCDLLESLTRDSKNKIAALDDLEGKAILVHPVADKAENGAFLRVEKVSRKGDRLILTGAPVLLEELDTIDEEDVVRIYLDEDLPRAGKADKKAKTKPAAFFPGLTPAITNGGVQPLGFGGLLAGSAPTVIVWKGVVPQVDFLGFVKPYVSDMSFRPEVKLDWKEKRGIEVGLQLDFEAEAGVDITGILGANGQLFKLSKETPDITMLAPTGLALPFKLTFSASLQCNAVSGGKIDFSGRQKVKIHAGGSAIIDPRPEAPPASWIRQGSWPFKVEGTSSFDVKKFQADPSVGLLCMVRLNANFSPKWFPMGGLFLTINPQFLLLVAENPKPQLAVNLGAGAWTKSDVAVELNLLTWKPDAAPKMPTETDPGPIPNF